MSPISQYHAGAAEPQHKHLPPHHPNAKVSRNTYHPQHSANVKVDAAVEQLSRKEEREIAAGLTEEKDKDTGFEPGICIEEFNRQALEYRAELGKLAQNNIKYKESSLLPITRSFEGMLFAATMSQNTTEITKLQSEQRLIHALWMKSNLTMPTNIRAEVRDSFNECLNMHSKDADISQADAMGSTQCIAPKAGFFGNAPAHMQVFAAFGLGSLASLTAVALACIYVRVVRRVRESIDHQRTSEESRSVEPTAQQRAYFQRLERLELTDMGATRGDGAV